MQQKGSWDPVPSKVSLSINKQFVAREWNIVCDIKATLKDFLIRLQRVCSIWFLYMALLLLFQSRFYSYWESRGELQFLMWKWQQHWKTIGRGVKNWLMLIVWHIFSISIIYSVSIYIIYSVWLQRYGSVFPNKCKPGSLGFTKILFRASCWSSASMRLFLILYAVQMKTFPSKVGKEKDSWFVKLKRVSTVVHYFSL